MKIFLISIFYVCFFSSCSVGEEDDCSYPNVMKVINDYSNSIEKEKNVVLRSYGLHYAGQDKVYDGKIHEIDLGYSIDKCIQYDEARSLFYSVVDGLLNKINENEKFRKYFYHFPVGYEDLFFRLSFDYEDKGHLKKDDVRQVNIFLNKISFHIVDEEKPFKMNLDKIESGVYLLKGFNPKTRTISKALPEEEAQKK